MSVCPEQQTGTDSLRVLGSRSRAAGAVSAMVQSRGSIGDRVRRGWGGCRTKDRLAGRPPCRQVRSQEVAWAPPCRRGLPHGPSAAPSPELTPSGRGLWCGPDSVVWLASWRGHGRAGLSDPRLQTRAFQALPRAPWLVLTPAR